MLTLPHVSVFCWEESIPQLTLYFFIDSKCYSDDGVIFRILADEEEIFTILLLLLQLSKQVDVQINHANILTLITDPGPDLDRIAIGLFGAILT
jgi:hypothetical protein